MLGSNVSTVGGLHMAFHQANAWQCDSIQVYTTPSRRWEVPPFEPERLAAFFEARAQSPVKVVVAHVPFLVNIAAAVSEAWERSRDRLITEIRRAAELDVAAVILHPGAAGDAPRKEAIRRASTALRDALSATSDLGVRVLIENMAGQGSTLCGRFEEIAELLSLVGPSERLGICFDTAHAFIAGYPLVGYEGYAEVMATLERIVGIQHVHAMHVNDALTNLGSRHDRHAPVGKGQMGPEPFHALMLDTRFGNIPRIVEVPARDEESWEALQLLRRMEVTSRPFRPVEMVVSQSVQLELDATDGGEG